jgi:hypothetical protein
VRKRHPFEAQALVVLGGMRRHGSLDLVLVLPDGSRSLIPAAWTDLEPLPEQAAGQTQTLARLSDLLRASAVAKELLRRAGAGEGANHGHDEEQDVTNRARRDANG